MHDHASGRERAAHDLAERMFFTLEKDGVLFSLSHKTGEFVSQHNLSIEEVERTLELWKLQGPHGG
jgi:hypothetical protein